MNRIKGVVMILLVSLCFSSSALAVDEETEVGIGFTTGTTTEPSKPDPDDVIPLTTSKSDPIGRLPQTGETKESKVMRLIGALCLAGAFWMFLFVRFKDEDEEDEAYE